MKYRNKGFTLVEIFITIAVLFILVEVFIYSSDEIVSTARAAVIINNLHIVKDAVLSFYSDNHDLFETGAISSGIHNYLNGNKKAINLIAKHFEGRDIDFQNMRSSNEQHMPFANEGSYGVADAGREEYVNKTDTIGSNIGQTHTRFTWFVGYRFKSNEGRVKEKVRARAKSMGLLFAGRIPNFDRLANMSDDQGNTINYSKGDEVVWLRVFGTWNKETGDWQVEDDETL